MEDDIFNLNEVDLDQLVDPTEGIPTNDPYWQIPSQDLSLFLQLASLFSWRTGRDLTSKSVSLEPSPDGSVLECRATDFDTYLTFRIPLTAEVPISNCLIFPTSTLSKLLKLCPKRLVIKQGSGSPAALILGQWVEIEPIVLDPSVFMNLDPVTKNGIITLPNLSNIIPIASSAAIPKDRNLSFYSNAVQCTYLWSILHVPFDTPVPFIVSAREASLLKALQSDNIELGITQSDLPRLSLSTPKATILLIHRKPESSITQLDLPNFTVQVDPLVIHTLVQLSETLPSSSGSLQFEYSGQTGLVITYCSKLSNTSYKISCNIEGSPTDLQPSILQTKMLKQLLKPMGNAPFCLSWNNETLFVQADNIKLSLKFES